MRSGILIVNKPAGITSHDVVEEVRKRTGLRRVGHTGTLDPFATGVLIICLDKATKLAEYISELPKSYQARLKLGHRSTTHDTEGKVTEVLHVTPPATEIIERVLNQFTGTIDQIPPMHSAIKIKGKKLYELAREGVTVKREPRKVTIYSIELLKYQFPDLFLEVTCSAGTYIRALARDIGKALGTGAYLENLTRIRVGDFTLAESVGLTALNPTSVGQLILPPERALSHLPRLKLKPEFARKLAAGQTLNVKITTKEDISEIAVFSEERELIAIAGYQLKNQSLFPKKVLI